MKKYQSTLIKRFKILFMLVMAMDRKELDPLIDKLEVLGNNIEAGHPQSLEALTYYEDNVLSILTEGMEVKELN